MSLDALGEQFERFGDLGSQFERFGEFGDSGESVDSCEFGDSV